MNLFENKDKCNQIILLLIFNYPVHPTSFSFKTKYAIMNNIKDISKLNEK